MTTLRAVSTIAAAAAVLVVAGCSATKYGKGCGCEATAVYPTPCYGGYEQPYSTGTIMAPPSQPAPMPAAEPLPLPTVPGGEVAPPPPPAEAGVHARPIREVSDTTRGLYYSMSSNIRAMFSR